MEKFIARENIDHYLHLLNGTGLGPEKRTTVTKLLIEGEDKIGQDLEQLEFAEKRAADGRDRLNHLRSKCELAHPEHRAQAERLVANVEAIQKLLEGFCHHLRRVSSRAL
jgi:hypothetical protein